MRIKSKGKKIIIGAIAGIALVGVGGYVVLNQRMDGMLGASVVNLRTSSNSSSDTSSSARASISQGYLMDYNWDEFPGTSPEFNLRATLDSNDDPKSVKVWFEYNTNKNFPLLTQRIVDLNKFTTVQDGRVSVEKPADAKAIFNQGTKYYGRFVVLTNRGFTRYEVPEFTTPLNCTVAITPVDFANTVQKGKQTIAIFDIKNNCNKEVSVGNVEIGFNGLHLSNPNGTGGLVSGIEIYSGNKLVNSTPKINFSAAWFDFKGEKIPAGGTKQFEMKAVVPNNVRTGESLVTRMELRGQAMRESNYSQQISPNTRTSDGKIPSPVVDTQAVWQLKVVQ